MNKNNDMHEQRFNGIVDDLEMVARKMGDVQAIAEGSSQTIKNDHTTL